MRIDVRSDDEYIIQNQFLGQPSSDTPIVSGLHYVSRLYRSAALNTTNHHSQSVLNEVLDVRSADRRRPPNGDALVSRLQHLEIVHHDVMTLMDDAPTSLRLDIDANDTLFRQVFLAVRDYRSLKRSFLEDWDVMASQDIKELFLNPQPNPHVVKDAFLVQQANIYVTQQMCRLIIIQHRDALLSLDPLTRLQYGATTTFAEKDKVASDLLVILRSIPIQVIAINSMSLLFKIRFVASSLLDALAAPATGKTGDTASTSFPPSVERAQACLCELPLSLVDVRLMT